jgi:hypothetical protein
MVPGYMIIPYEVHVPSFRGTATEEWDPPTPDCEPTLHALGGHYLLSESGFPPENAADLALPVVDAEGRLHRTALLRARRELREREDISVSTATTGIEVVSRLIDRPFEREYQGATDAQSTLANLTAPSLDEGDEDTPAGESAPTVERGEEDERSEPPTR